MRLITLIYFACGNLAETGTPYATLLNEQTSLLDSMIDIIMKCKKVPSDTARHMAWLLRQMAKSQLNCEATDKILQLVLLSAKLDTDDQVLLGCMEAANSLISRKEEVAHKLIV